MPRHKQSKGSTVVLEPKSPGLSTRQALRFAYLVEDLLRAMKRRSRRGVRGGSPSITELPFSDILPSPGSQRAKPRRGRATGRRRPRRWGVFQQRPGGPSPIPSPHGRDTGARRMGAPQAPRDGGLRRLATPTTMAHPWYRLCRVVHGVRP